MCQHRQISHKVFPSELKHCHRVKTLNKLARFFSQKYFRKMKQGGKSVEGVARLKNYILLKYR